MQIFAYLHLWNLVTISFNIGGHGEVNTAVKRAKTPKLKCWFLQASNIGSGHSASQGKGL